MKIRNVLCVLLCSISLHLLSVDGIIKQTPELTQSRTLLNINQDFCAQRFDNNLCNGACPRSEHTHIVLVATILASHPTSPIIKRVNSFQELGDNPWIVISVTPDIEHPLTPPTPKK